MRNQFDRIEWVRSLQRPLHTDNITRERGYAVAFGETYFWFRSLEPAYAFGQAGRMSEQVGSWDLRRAVAKVRSDPDGRHQVRTLRLLESDPVRSGVTNERELLQQFVDGVRENSSH